MTVEQRCWVQEEPNGAGKKSPSSLPVACAILVRQHTVDPYGDDSFGGADRVAESSRIDNCLRIEEHQVSGGAFADSTASGQSESLRGHAGHFMNRLRQTGRYPVPGNNSPAPEETFPKAGDVAGVVGQPVGADHGCRVSQDAAHILFRHAVVDRSRGLQARRRFPLLRAPGKGNLLQRLAGHFGVWRGPGDRRSTRSSTWRRSRVLEEAA